MLVPLAIPHPHHVGDGACGALAPGGEALRFESKQDGLLHRIGLPGGRPFLLGVSLPERRGAQPRHLRQQLIGNVRIDVLEAALHIMRPADLPYRAVGKAQEIGVGGLVGVIAGAITVTERIRARPASRGGGIRRVCRGT